MTDIQKFITAVGTFQAQYNALPGDMSNATKYWGAAGAPTNTWAGCYGIVGTGTQTCDGNGDGLIGPTWGPTVYAEEYRAWQHLSLAGLIEGSYTGVNGYSDGTQSDGIAGTNIPKGPMNNTGYEMVYLGNNVGIPSPYTWWPPVNLGHAILFGGSCPANTTCWTAGIPVLTPAEQGSLDQKYDDGLPFSGTISTLANNCATSPYTLTSTYNFTNQGQACGIVYVTGF
jgi:hypothetical protein